MNGIGALSPSDPFDAASHFHGKWLPRLPLSRVHRRRDALTASEGTEYRSDRAHKVKSVVLPSQELEQKNAKESTRAFEMRFRVSAFIYLRPIDSNNFNLSVLCSDFGRSDIQNVYCAVI